MKNLRFSVEDGTSKKRVKKFENSIKKSGAEVWGWKEHIDYLITQT